MEKKDEYSYKRYIKWILHLPDGQAHDIFYSDQMAVF